MNYDTLQGMTPVHLLKNTKCNPHSGSLKAVLLNFALWKQGVFWNDSPGKQERNLNGCFGPFYGVCIFICLTGPIFFLLGENVEILPAEFLLTTKIRLQIHSTVL